MYEIGDEVIIENNDKELRYEADFENDKQLKHGSTPRYPHIGIVRNQSEYRLLIEYEIGTKIMCLSFPKDACKPVNKKAIEFKPGDRVECIHDPTAGGVYVGDKGTVYQGETKNWLYITFDGKGTRGGYYRTDFKLINNFINNDLPYVNKEGTTMNDLLNKFKDALLGEPERSLQKYGIITNQGNLTSQGTELYLNWKFKNDLETFQKDVLAVLIKADKKTKKDEE